MHANVNGPILIQNSQEEQRELPSANRLKLELRRSNRDRDYGRAAQEQDEEDSVEAGFNEQ